MTWEGPLSAAANGSSLATVDGPQIRTGQIVVDSFGMKMTDPARPFCEVGAEPFDILQIHGCNPANGDAECPSDYTCYVHPRSKVSGIGSCMRIDEADRFATACYDFLATNRRYTISATSPGELKLVPRKHELYATPVNGCTDDNQCDAIAQYVAVNNVAADPFVVADPNNPKLSHTEWSCQADEQRAPINAVPALNKRCVQTCAFHSTDEALKAAGDPSFDGVDRDADCSAGSICVGATYSPTSDLASRGACMEGVVPPPACVNGPQQYDVRASEAFTVIGSQSGYVHPFVAQGESCVVDPTAAQTPSASRLNIGRIPFKAPACLPPDQVNQITGEVIAQPGTFEPNPCSLTVQQTEYQNNYVAGTCDLDTATPSLLVPREAPAIKFSNRAMTVDLVDPTYPGDKTCIQDRQGPFTDVSLVPPGATPLAIGYQLSFDQKAGFDPMIMPGVSAALPVKLVRGPSESVWILDDGDFLSTTLGVASTSGQVFRIESTNINIVNLLQ